MTAKTKYPEHISHTTQPLTVTTNVMNESGDKRQVDVPEEQPLKIIFNGKELVTLMTLGSHPESLALGYLRNQGLANTFDEIDSVQVDWSNNQAEIHSLNASQSNSVDPAPIIQQLTSNDSSSIRICKSYIYALLGNISKINKIYRTAGGVHGSALCHKSEILCFVEDIGRHNATDTIAGEMWLRGITETDKYLYLTGRLTSEIVIKAARMQIPLLLSRSGVTRLGLEIAQELNITMIARAKGMHFLVYHGFDTILLDA